MLAMRTIHVLLVEDNPGDARLVRELLAGNPDPGFRLAVVATFAAALAQAIRGQCDVVLLDLSLPDSRGVETVQQLALAVPRVPIVVLTGLDHEQAALEALRHGAEDYLVKGQVDSARLIRSLRHSIERKAFETVLAERAHFDALTGLVNRALLHDRLNHALARAGRTRKRVALIFIDLDAFKGINDSRGHEAGDRVLKEAARRLSGIARRGDTIARFGGDEFIVVVEEIDNASHAAVVAQRILAAFDAPVAVSPEESMRISCSIGIAIFPDSAADAESLIRNADTAMFLAKKAGGNNAKCFGDRAQETPP